MEHLRLNGAYWGLATLDILGKLHAVDEDEVVSWIMECQHESGGFGGNIGHDPHVMFTLSAIQVLALFNKIDVLDIERVSNYIASLQNEDGSFSGDIWGETDTRKLLFQFPWASSSLRRLFSRKKEKEILVSIRRFCLSIAAVLTSLLPPLLDSGMTSQMNSSLYSQYLSQSFSQQNSQTPTQSQDEVGSHRGKTTWDDNKTKVFINLCVAEVRAGNRPGSHFSTLGWKNLVENFNKVTNLNCTRIQLKNHWDHLKRRWKDWRRLLRNETGLGWDFEKETIGATDEWWDRKIKEAPEVKMFRDKGPLLVAEQEFLFDDVIATGSRIWLPISGVLPPHMQEEDVDPVDPVDDDTTPINVDPVDDEGSSLRRKNPFSAIIRKKTKKANTGEALAKSFSTVAELIKNKRTSPTCSPQYTIKECLEVLEKMDNIEEGDEMWLFATDLFLDPTKRELLLEIKKDETRFMWLKRAMERDKIQNTRFYTSGQDSYGQSQDNASSH